MDSSTLFLICMAAAAAYLLTSTSSSDTSSSFFTPSSSLPDLNWQNDSSYAGMPDTGTNSIFDTSSLAVGGEDVTAIVGDPVQFFADTQATMNNNFIDAWAAAIQQHEGWQPGSLSYRNNNPGNLKGPQPGAINTDAKGFAVFANVAAGTAALKIDLQSKVRKYPNYSILQIMTRYLGGNVNNPQVTAEGDPFAYADAVAGALGVDVSTTLGSMG